MQRDRGKKKYDRVKKNKNCKERKKSDSSKENASSANVSYTRSI